MDATLQRHCAKFIYVVPEGLRELMSDISREVLRSQPEDIYTFIADYMDALLITRENARVASRLVNTITEIAITTIELLENVGVDYEDAERIASIVQDVFRKHMQLQTSLKEPPVYIAEDIQEANIMQEIFDSVRIPEHVAEQSAQIIQNAYRKFKVRRERERDILRGMVDWRIAARSAIHLYRKTGVTKEEADRAATLIKAAYKGYFTRKMVKRLAGESYEIQEAGGEESFVFDLVSESEASGPDVVESGEIAAKQVMSELLTRTMAALTPIEQYLTTLEMEGRMLGEGQQQQPKEKAPDIPTMGKDRIPVFEDVPPSEVPQEAVTEPTDLAEEQITEVPGEAEELMVTEEKTEPVDESAEEQPITEATEVGSEVADSAVVEELTADVEAVTEEADATVIEEASAVPAAEPEAAPPAEDPPADLATDNEPTTDAETTDAEPATTTDAETTEPEDNEE